MEQQRLSVGFVESTGFMRISERLDGPALVTLVQMLYDTAGDVIVRHGGRIQKYIGDAVLFTCPDPRAAVQIAREIVANGDREIEGITTGRYVAVATGDVLVTEIGHASYRLQDVFGVTVNQAAILLRDAKQSPTRVALCPETIRAAGIA